MADRLDFEIDVELETGLITGHAGVPGLIEAFRQTGTAVGGHRAMRERTGFGILVALLQFGVLSDDLTRRNMDLFAAEVMPYLRG